MMGKEREIYHIIYYNNPQLQLAQMRNTYNSEQIQYIWSRCYEEVHFVK